MRLSRTFVSWLSAWMIIAFLGFASQASAHEPAVAPAAADGLDASARQPAAVVDAFHAALGRGDTQAALGFLTEAALIFEAGGVERSKAEYASHHLAADAAFSQAVPAVVTRRAGQAIGEIAWIATEGHTTGIWKGKAVDRVTTETMVLRRTAEGWKIVHIHWSSAARGQ